MSDCTGKYGQFVYTTVVTSEWMIYQLAACAGKMIQNDADNNSPLYRLLPPPFELRYSNSYRRVYTKNQSTYYIVFTIYISLNK